VGHDEIREYRVWRVGRIIHIVEYRMLRKREVEVSESI
jgi:hypothetical protein